MLSELGPQQFDAFGFIFGFKEEVAAGKGQTAMDSAQPNLLVFRQVGCSGEGGETLVHVHAHAHFVGNQSIANFRGNRMPCIHQR